MVPQGEELCHSDDLTFQQAFPPRCYEKIVGS